ncbi:hypothetical protein CTAYLR_009155 [Chrysophaeum taylorii]|uniref:Serine aminopeptidase S33 domain-containing protein n=1 Tax=Chrysophaeum taylorii TaxID=2483200 RepID=A0AAD7UHS8_9STRA|nr:hypothetical protein CTAYLR_009155 [Chrysophaeum taylorii]
MGGVERIEFSVGGDRVVGHLHLPAGEKYPGIVVGGPMTSVKEQVTGTYAAAMASRGFAALAIDHRHYGESGGAPRQYEYYPHKLEDLAAAFEALRARPDITDVFALGICLGCGYLARTIADKAVVVKGFGAVAGYYRDVEAMKRSDAAGFEEKVAAGRAARIKFETTGELDVIPAVLPPGEGDAAMTMQSTFDYYGPGGRMAVPNYKNEFAVMSREFFLQFDVQPAASKLGGTPFIMLHGQNAIAPPLAHRFFDAIPGTNKSKVDLSSEGQTDIYDSPAIVNFAADKLAAFFSTL